MLKPRHLVLAALLLVMPCAASATDGLTEPATGMTFAGTLDAVELGEGTTLELTGVGVRKKLVFKVYAFALYADAGALRSGLDAYRGRDADTLRADDAFYEDFVNAKVTRSAVLRFARSVSVEKIRNAFDDAIGDSVPKDDPAREAFLALFSGEIDKGDEFRISFGPEGVIHVVGKGTVRGSVESPPLAIALIASWLGEKPVSEDIKEGVVERIPELLSAS